MASELERRIRGLEAQRLGGAVEPMGILVTFVDAKLGIGSPYYAWSRDDFSDLIERRADESEEEFGARMNDAFIPETEGPGAAVGFCHVAPRLDEERTGDRLEPISKPVFSDSNEPNDQHAASSREERVK